MRSVADALSSLAQVLERVDNCVHPTVLTRERDEDAVALRCEWIRLAVTAALGAGAIVLIARAVADADLRQVTHERNTFGPSIGRGRPGG